MILAKNSYMNIYMIYTIQVDDKNNLQKENKILNKQSFKSTKNKKLKRKNKSTIYIIVFELSQ